VIAHIASLIWNGTAITIDAADIPMHNGVPIYNKPDAERASSKQVAFIQSGPRLLTSEVRHL
jgi:hypothetical protein